MEFPNIKRVYRDMSFTVSDDTKLIIAYKGKTLSVPIEYHADVFEYKDAAFMIMLDFVSMSTLSTTHFAQVIIQQGIKGARPMFTHWQAKRMHRWLQDHTDTEFINEIQPFRKNASAELDETLRHLRDLETACPNN